MCTKRRNFTGHLPPITNAPKLEKLLLWGNKLTGNVSNSISNASMLQILDLARSATDHEWTFLSSLANCRHLRKIAVSGNPLSGVLPTYVGNLSKSLQYFYASNCELQGIIPMEIEEFNRLNFQEQLMDLRKAICLVQGVLDMYVYKGRLSDGMEVAIKVFNLQTECAFWSFDIEWDAMHNIVHRNIVKVITCCSSVDFKALVLDYMSNGNLEQWLHSKNYNDMVALVGDFGISKILGEGDVVKQTMTLATIGYMAP
ncbi:hypothetical protein Gotri_027669, partial [Gossypium trilobum]|nr:hypothetical protein [Gossypium trilobum]